MWGEVGGAGMVVEGREDYFSLLAQRFMKKRRETSNGQAPVVQKVDSAIHWINYYPEDMH